MASTQIKQQEPQAAKAAEVKIDFEHLPIPDALKELGVEPKTGLSAAEAEKHRAPPLQTAMFMQLVIAGHLLLFSTRSQGFFFQRRSRKGSFSPPSWAPRSWRHSWTRTAGW